MATLKLVALIIQEYDMPDYLLKDSCNSEKANFIASKQVDFLDRNVGQCQNSKVECIIDMGF